MGTQQRWVAAQPGAVWAVLADGWSYAGFVVGSTHVRAVDPRWPAPGARLLPTVGAWPLQREGETRCEEADAPRRLVVTARGWPLGEARVVFALEPRDGGTLVSLTEDAVAGPGALVPAPLRHVTIDARNRETLARLEALALRRPA
ncbi:SRPBCC family protein [Quadrisphaera sp. INWT6]|uniref:SRPBCC family protein n=1 Tax=Quadrisphaera sp. INWT6 TaxID=2596917 RepID=UPI00189260D3|nr:SRPBCC family protein [Quadrisphaera sp. INWT6]MBF5082242.1 SRPBCC family protein [Quadrisphaera sp. INWT6]